VARVLFFAQARDATGCRRAEIDAPTVGDVIDAASARWPQLAAVIDVSAIWLNGEPAARGDQAGPDDEIAVLPPVSGGGC
jgi:molybdopterin converting factor small subunit